MPGVVVGVVDRTRLPVHAELALSDAVSDQAETHVHCLGALDPDRVVGDDFRHDAQGGQDEDVDLGMSQEPKQVLPEDGAAAAGDVEGSIAEVQRAAKRGFRALSLPCKPVWGAPNHEHKNYNLPEFDPLWAAISDVDLPMTFHVSTGRDPRTARGNGGAVINYAVHSLAPTMEPLINLCASGVIERFPNLQFGSIEAGIGWVPWMLTAMDEAYHKHHMWVRPKLKQLPSEYFRTNGFATFGEDKPGLDLMREYDLADNFMWANDFPHHEGTWPHSAAAIERTMSHLTDDERAKILGLNAARIFKFDIPERYHKFPDCKAAAARA